jgi:hypothetical protein
MECEFGGSQTGKAVGGSDSSEENMSERCYFDSLWFVSNRRNRDFLAQIVHTEGGNWKLHYRFSSYTDPEPFSDSDKRSYYEVQTDKCDDATLQRLRAGMTSLKGKLESLYGNPMDIVELQCWNDESKILFELGSRPWANIKYESIKPENAANG